MGYETLRYEVQEGVAHITLDRGDGLNTIDHRMAQEFVDVAIRCSEDTDVRAVLLDGAGANFCAGGDLKSFLEVGDDLPGHLKERTMYFHSGVARLVHGHAPVVVAAHGNVIGGGLAFVCLADVAVTAETTTFRMGYTALGLTPDGGATFGLPRLVGLRRAMDLALTNRPFGASEAEAWGLTNYVVADDELADEAMALASRLAAGPTATFGRTKSLLRESVTETMETHLDAESRAIAAAAGSQDAAEGIRAFAEKRSPAFKGR